MVRPLAVVAALTTLLATLVPASGRAQPLAIFDRTPTDGITLPPTGAALADEATAPEINPAGLAALGGPQLQYLHERNVPVDSVSDAVFLGARLSGVGGALGLQWIRPDGRARYRKVSYSLSVGSPRFALGGTFNNFFSPNPVLDDLSSWDLGLLVRPASFLSLGASIRDIDQPKIDGERLPVRYDVGLGLRPFGDRVTLGADLLVDSRGGFDASRLSLVAQLEPLDGVRLQGGLGVPLDGGDLVGQVGLTLDTGYLGAGYYFGASDPISRPDHLIQARLSSERYRGLAAPRARYVEIDLEERLSRRPDPLEALLQPSRPDPWLQLLSDLSRVPEDPSVRGLVVRMRRLGGIGQGRAEELRDALEAVRRSGKRVVVWFADGGDNEYLIASAADRIYAPPQATFMVNGLTATRVYLGEGLARLGVTIDVARVGEYKSAPDQLTRSDMAPEERAMLEAYLDGVFPRFVSTVARARNLSEAQVREQIDRGIFSGEAAREAGLADAIAYPDELEPLIEAAEGGRVELKRSMPAEVAVPRRWGAGPRVAVLQIQGTIAEGKSRSDPFGATRIAGAHTIVEQLERVRGDSGVRALVLRIETGGGSGAASDLIWRAVRRVRERKPVVVSMGDVAASGGYYIAVAADEIFAQPGTLTGSIGVFAIKPGFGPLLEKLGIEDEVVKRGEKADLLSLTRRWTEAEQRQMQQLIDDYYDVFVARVAEGRRLERERVDSIARGRVWSGAAAKEIGLVDQLGGLHQAIERAKARAGLAGKDVEVELLREEHGAFELPFGTIEQRQRLRALMRTLAPDWALAMLALEPGPLAVMPSRIEVQ